MRSRVEAPEGGGRRLGGAGPPLFPPRRSARPTHLRGRQPRPHLPHQEGLQAAARGAEEPGACGPSRQGISRNRHGSSGAAPRRQGHVASSVRGASPRATRDAEWHQRRARVWRTQVSRERPLGKVAGPLGNKRITWEE